MLANNGKLAFGQQEVDVRHPSGLGIVYGYHRASGAAILHRFYRRGKTETRQGQRIGIPFIHRAVRIRARCTLKRDGARRVGCSGGVHFLNHGERWSGV